MKKLSPYALAGVFGTIIVAVVGVGTPDAEPNEELVGVGSAEVDAVGSVACAAGPRAAERGVAGRGIEMGEKPLSIPVLSMVVEEVITGKPAPLRGFVAV